MKEWRWIGETLILAIHEQQLAEHGGDVGVRDVGLLRSALARPRNRAAYADADAFDLAAAYAFGVTKNHPFVDGNKRTAFVAAVVFLLDNGQELHTADADVVRAVVALSDGTMSEQDFAVWLRSTSAPV
jgi:death-on-curing protein